MRSRFKPCPQVMYWPRACGKTAASEKMIAEYTKENPKATIVRIKPGETIVEEYIGDNKK